MLFGPHAARKLTAAIEGYVIKRLPELLADERTDHRQPCILGTPDLSFEVP
ncbi:MAG: hypothetical protein ACKVY0_12820 [Prosthecobacter sp.]|uniref:hypothetical protein n=1 Tax=Prosthecobacter sp. TaxID=1965333 RepID=UPI0039040ABD